MTAFTLRRRKKVTFLSKQGTQISLIPMNAGVMDQKQQKKTKNHQKD